MSTTLAPLLPPTYWTGFQWTTFHRLDPKWRRPSDGTFLPFRGVRVVTPWEEIERGVIVTRLFTLRSSLCFYLHTYLNPFVPLGTTTPIHNQELDLTWPITGPKTYMIGTFYFNLIIIHMYVWNVSVKPVLQLFIIRGILLQTVYHSRVMNNRRKKKRKMQEFSVFVVTETYFLPSEP